jgi:phosphotransferase system HPr (HPr) family protein
MIRKERVIKSEAGLHARPAAMFVELANSFKSYIKLETNDRIIDGKSIMSILSAAIVPGSSVLIIIDGEDEVEASKALDELMNSGFGEK